MNYKMRKRKNTNGRIKGMKKVAKFSNGFTDEYKGKRAVTAAWMITDKDGEVVASGHSLDKNRAEKTSRAHYWYEADMKIEIVAV